MYVNELQNTCLSFKTRLEKSTLLVVASYNNLLNVIKKIISLFSQSHNEQHLSFQVYGLKRFRS